MPDDHDFNPAARATMTKIGELHEAMAKMLDEVNATALEIARLLRAGDLLRAVRANHKIGERFAEAMAMNATCHLLLQRIRTEDPAGYQSVVDAVNREGIERRVEGWTADQCRAAIEQHVRECDEPSCYFVAVLQERIAFHEPN